MTATLKALPVGKWPAWLYNALPYTYLAMGLVVAVTGFVMSNLLGVLSGILLICTGVMAFTMRMQYRKDARVRAEFALRAQNENEDEYKLLQLTWRKQYESGNAVIDGQHQLLFNVSTALLNAILESRPSSEITVLLDLLLKDVGHHLLTEEKVLADLHHPISIEHKTVHDHLLGRLKSIVGKYRSGTLLFGELIEFVTYDFIAQHIVTEDKHYFVPRAERDLNIPKVAADSHINAAVRA
jgi:hemerythrin-like metal-binding protein